MLAELAARECGHLSLDEALRLTAHDRARLGLVVVVQAEHRASGVDESIDRRQYALTEPGLAAGARRLAALADGRLSPPGSRSENGAP